VQIELLVVPGCPHAIAAAAALTEAARQAGAGDAPIIVTMISSDQQARARAFAGSPTFLIDGADPFAKPHTPAGLACRMYSSSGSGPAGVPDLDDLRDALLRAGTGPASAAGDR
jgi:hypothetical protein